MSWVHRVSAMVSALAALLLLAAPPLDAPLRIAAPVEASVASPADAHPHDPRIPDRKAWKSGLSAALEETAVDDDSEQLIRLAAGLVASDALFDPSTKASRIPITDAAPGIGCPRSYLPTGPPSA